MITMDVKDAYLMCSQPKKVKVSLGKGLAERLGLQQEWIEGPPDRTPRKKVQVCWVGHESIHCRLEESAGIAAAAQTSMMLKRGEVENRRDDEIQIMDEPEPEVTE